MNKPLDIKNFEQTLGAENCISDLEVRELFSQDIWHKGETVDFVISPRSTEQLANAVKLADRKKIALNPRGSGMSYTKGYTSDLPNTGLIDFSKMNRILEINQDDMYITVEAGCTWKQIYDALSPLGLRTPFWGPLSGLKSTIGGGLSQNNAFFGSGTYGPSTDSVTSLTVVLADGTIVKTGTAASASGKPFWRQYGPDITGLFLSDTGALGYKAEATLRLIPMPESEGWLSFEYDNQESWINVQAEIGRLGIACELFGFDPNLQRFRMERAGLATDVKTLGKVITNQKGGILKGLKEGAKVAMAGRSYMDDVAFSMHIVVEGHSDAEVKAKLATLKDIALRYGGNEIENSIPKIMRANPFSPLNSVLGPRGERWVPIHGIVAMGDALDCQNDITKFFEEMSEEFEKFQITTGYLLTTLSTNGFLIEPVFIWPEEIWPIHEQTVDKNRLKGITRFKQNPEATECVNRGRQGVMEIFSKYGAAHFQIGRTYPYRKTRSPEFNAILDGIKNLLDPENRVNPGSLGLN